MSNLTPTGQRYADEVLSHLQWWAVGVDVDAAVIDRAAARFLAELGVECCVRCGHDEVYARGLCKQHYQSAWRRKRSPTR